MSWTYALANRGLFVSEKENDIGPPMLVEIRASRSVGLVGLHSSFYDEIGSGLYFGLARNPARFLSEISVVSLERATC